MKRRHRGKLFIGLLAGACAAALAPADVRTDRGAGDGELSPPGIVEMVSHRRSGVVSAWLGNGVRLHHLRLPASGSSSGEGDAAARVLIMAAVAGGEIEESEATRGLSAAAAWGWAAEVRDGEEGRALRERRIGLNAYASGDAIVLRIDAPADELDEAVRLLGRMLTAPAISQPTLDRWASWYVERNRRNEGGLRWVVARAMADATRPSGDVRFRTLLPEEASSIRAAAAQAWLERMLGVGDGGQGVRPAPLEVAIVGDVALAEALHAAERELAPLPERDRIGPGTHAALRRRAAPAGPLEVRTLLPVRGGAACAGAGFFGPQTFDQREHRVLTLAAYIIDERVTTKVRERGWAGIDDVITVAAAGGIDPAEDGLVLSAAAVKPGTAAAMADLTAGVIADLAATGPTPDELRRAREWMLRNARRAAASRWEWAAQLCRLTHRGTGTPDDLADAEGMIESITAADITAALQRYATPQRAIRLIVDPEPEIGAPLR